MQAICKIYNCNHVHDVESIKWILKELVGVNSVYVLKGAPTPTIYYLARRLQLSHQLYLLPPKVDEWIAHPIGFQQVGQRRHFQQRVLVLDKAPTLAQNEEREGEEGNATPLVILSPQQAWQQQCINKQ